MEPAPNDRIRTLDLIRGVAVLGIVAINVAGFAAPESAAYSPNLPHPTGPANQWAYMANLVLFEGKMRALFSLLFGASLLLFIERADAAGRDGAALQLRRLGWLALFGVLHFTLLWDGDILFLYAVVGLVALGLRHLRPAQLVTAALLLLVLWQAMGSAMWGPSVVREHAVLSGDPSPTAQRNYAELSADFRQTDARDQAEAQLSWPGAVEVRVAGRPEYLPTLVFYNWGETLPLMLLGMALLRSGFFAGQWTRRRLRQVAAGGIALGGGVSLAFALWARGAGYPELAMHYALSYGLVLPHLALALGYAALLVLAASLPPSPSGEGPGVGAVGEPNSQTHKPHPNPSPKGEGLKRLATTLVQQLEAAGRMAFSNYIATSLILTALCSGWGLGLYGQFGPAQRWTLVLLVWALMLSWSQPWLARYRQGPLEWAWRSLTEWRWLALR